MRMIVNVVLFVGLWFPLQAQHIDTLVSTGVNHNRLRTWGIASGAAYTLTMVGLNQIWYSKAPKQSFQFFNDNQEWNQLDKAGHFYSAFQISYFTSKGLQWCNLNEIKSDLWGSLIGFFVLVPIEIMDGYSAAYGASSGDLLADALGAGFYWGQKKVWKEIRIYPKFSFRPSSYASLRPNVLGDTFMSEIIKDYNGQTYWLSFDIDKFIRFPSWLNVAIGYGANEMVYAHESANQLAGYSSYRQYYLSLDLDLKGIHTQSKGLKMLFEILSLIKLPSPSLEFSKNGTQFYFLH